MADRPTVAAFQEQGKLETDQHLAGGGRRRPTRRLGPGLELRLKRLEEQNRVRDRDAASRTIGRIPESQIAEIERLQRARANKAGVRRRTSAWTMPGGVRLSGGPVLDDTDHEAAVVFDSDDVSSVIDISDSLAPSETDDDRDELRDTNKYRLPFDDKTRLDLHTKEPLSPTPRPVQPSAAVLSRPRSSTPTTPTTHCFANDPPLGPCSPTQPCAPAPSSSPAPRPSPASHMVSTPPRWANGGAENGSDSEVTRPSLSRAGSIYTLGRASFTGQLAQLTSMRLPDGNSLAKRISSIPTSTEAARALADASEQIRMWISKASDVLDGLNAEDDVEWAAAGGREGMEEVDNAINRFQQLVEVYILSIERLQTRDDVGLLTVEENKASEHQLETIVASWKQIRGTLNGIKKQVEIAMEWEQLWNTVLGEIAQEMDGLNRLVFEMEEKRHSGAGNLLSSKDSIDLSELETIIEDQPGRPAINNRLSIAPLSLGSPMHLNENKEDSSLLALFARMQPLRASLEFLPMRLSTWQVRGKDVFPSACLDLDHRRDQLESQWSKLEADADSLRRELGEDRWVLVFRNAGRQALKMCESITRSHHKLKDAIDRNEQQTHAADLQDKIENYEAKKRHYGPAIERVLAIIDRGVLDRLTLNGEILRLQSEMKQRWAYLQREMTEMGLIIEEVNIESRDIGLRDSVSTVISSERSVGSSMLDTPGTSPASSVIGASRRDSVGSRTPTSLTTIKTRNSSSKPNDRLAVSGSLPRRTLNQRKSYGDMHASPQSASSIPTPSKTPVWPSRPDPMPSINKGRWQNAIKPEAHDFRPLSAFEPSPYAKTPVTPKMNHFRTSQNGASTPSLGMRSRTPAPRVFSAPHPQPSYIPGPIAATPGGSRDVSLSVPAGGNTARQRSPLRTKASAPVLGTHSTRPPSRLLGPSGRRSSMLPKFTDGNDADNESPAHHRRSPSATMNCGRLGVIPSAGRAMSRLGQSAGESKPKWRP
ncbi:related to MUC1 Extracellular alpha-1,4-glucan glucosidase [Ramularia collo-cygni]|uniref:Related to MUC1 Extracellular alpha-1,4-glucan glucosidase n=1 Tax=Ramularia collo-cygni TaxID=112498 RepID=A0A2D3UP53_9PEZI|nr:related to MUC1 Extracellular alpha-1,4-glucan glucosidase [Ramularia collo-cygni]CZT14505.1 related to MUC1 Extracellular alpha-1,4-glucan glucosidase [Ramularia collo-cygni]